MRLTIKHFLLARFFAFLLTLLVVTPVQPAKAECLPPLNLKSVTIISALTGTFGLYATYQYVVRQFPFDLVTIELPKITYKKNIKVTPEGKPLIKLTPRVSYQKLEKKELSEVKLNQWKAEMICDPIMQLEYLTYQQIMYKSCIQWFDRHKLLFPHEYSQTTLSESSKVVLPELLFNMVTYDFALIVTSIVIGGKKPELRSSNRSFIYFHPTNDSNSITFNEDFKTCHFTRDVPAMNEPEHGVDGLAYFQFMSQGVTHLHHDNSQYIIATRKSSDAEQSVPYWRLGERWPEHQDNFKVKNMDDLTAAPNKQ